jgi:segregation and condensation protein A
MAVTQPAAEPEPSLIPDASGAQAAELAESGIRFTGRPVRLPMFEGPLDLLLYLIEQQQIDIYDIPIAKITSQYLDYLTALEVLNIEIEAEFLVMAATLVEIKSRMLLPREEQVGEEGEEGPDPRAELVERLLEYRRYKEVAEALGRRAEQRALMFSRALLDGDVEVGYAVEGEVTPLDLWSAFQEALSRARETPVAELQRPRITVPMKIAQVTARLRASGEQGVAFFALFDEDVTRLEVIITFLALLELIRAGRARGIQRQGFGEIWIYPNGHGSAHLTR